jgi:hypothetical protein
MFFCLIAFLCIILHFFIFLQMFISSLSVAANAVVMKPNVHSMLDSFSYFNSSQPDSV